MGKRIVPVGKDSVNEAIKAIGQELIRRADDISNDIKKVNTITIHVTLTPEEITNFDITKNYIAEFEEN